MSKKPIEKPKEVIDESSDLDECLNACAEFLRTHPHPYKDRVPIPHTMSEEEYTVFFRQWLKELSERK